MINMVVSVGRAARFMLVAALLAILPTQSGCAVGGVIGSLFRGGNGT